MWQNDNDDDGNRGVRVSWLMEGGNMGYFSAVDFRNNPTGTPGYKDIDITVTEQSTGSINVGAGFSSIDSLVGFFSLTQTNFDITNWPNVFAPRSHRMQWVAE